MFVGKVTCNLNKKKKTRDLAVVICIPGCACIFEKYREGLMALNICQEMMVHWQRYLDPGRVMI